MRVLVADGRIRKQIQTGYLKSWLFLIIIFSLKIALCLKIYTYNFFSHGLGGGTCPQCPPAYATVDHKTLESKNLDQVSPMPAFGSRPIETVTTVAVAAPCGKIWATSYCLTAKIYLCRSLATSKFVKILWLLLFNNLGELVAYITTTLTKLRSLHYEVLIWITVLQMSILSIVNLKLYNYTVTK